MIDAVLFRLCEINTINERLKLCVDSLKITIKQKHNGIKIEVIFLLHNINRDLPCPFLEVSWIGEPTPGNDPFALVIRPRGQFEDIIVSEAENDGAKSKILDEIELGVD